MRPAAVQALRASGWFPGRRFDPRQELRVLKLAGYEVVQAAQVVMESLGGLTVAWPVRADDETSAKGLEERIEFTPSRAIEWDVVPAHVEDWKARARESITPIGTYVDQPVTFLIGASGAGYLARGRLLWRIGLDFWSGIEALITGDELIEI